MPLPNLRYTNGVAYLGHKHAILKYLQKELPRPSLHGHQVWHSGGMLMEYLQTIDLPCTPRFIEIGCGWGLTGIFCAKYLAGDVLLTDADERVLPYAKVHSALNQVTLTTAQASFDCLTNEQLCHRDVLIGSDICFWPEMRKQLQSLIGRAFDSGVQKVVMADPGRAPFLQLANFAKRRYSADLISWKTSSSKHGGYLLVANNPDLALTA